MNELAPLSAASVVSQLQNLIAQHGNLPVTFGDEGWHIRIIEAVEIPRDNRLDSSIEFLCVGW